ncbi:heparinase II/III domain-containing protein [Gemmatimonas sp.]
MLLPLDIEARRRDTAPGTSLGDIADGLDAELRPWLQAPLPIPEAKARLTRLGGRCPVHGTLLVFDPSAPHAHRCEACNVAYTNPEHHQWWAMGAQLFTAERTVHAAALYLLRGDVAYRELAIRTLGELAARYSSWPNRDNVLGPTRPFFSTYLESIWLLNLCHALSLLEAAGAHDIGQSLRDNVLEPSSALIATYHEGRSNRQVWNEVALLSAWTMLGEHARVAQRLDSKQSLPMLLETGLLADGTWFEGDNYHQFAHRGLWYGAQLLRSIGRPVSPIYADRFHEGFVTPFAGLLPDDTSPARRDSQYAVSVRQWRWAEWCELGYAWRADQRLGAVLRRLYDGSGPRDTTQRATSTADAERNGGPVALSRADCSWRALLMAQPHPVPAGLWEPVSVCLPKQGLAVMRRQGGQVYAALDGGAEAGGHGHPDRLHLTLQHGTQRPLNDPGTGSYVERTLHWYRSTLAHHAPLVDGASQQPGETTLTAFEDRGGAGWMQKRAVHLAPDVHATRTVVVCDGYLVDVLEWDAERDVTITLPVSVDMHDNLTDWKPEVRAGAGGLEDGFDFLSNVEGTETAPAVVHLLHDSGTMAWYATSRHGAWWRAIAPGAPASAPQQRLLVDVPGGHGRIVGVWAWAPVESVHVNATGPVLAVVTTRDGTVASHEAAAHGWHIGLLARHARSSIDLGFSDAGGHASHAASRFPSPPADGAETGAVAYHVRPVSLLIPHSHEFSRWLGEAHYVATEEAWGGTNAPTARLAIGRTASHLVVTVHAFTGHAPVVPSGGDPHHMPANPLDNERADVNADGVQCYFGRQHDRPGHWQAAVLAVPLADGTARVTSLVANGPVPEAHAESLPDGWRMVLRWRLETLPLDSLTFDLIVNERPPERERRRGQLVLSGGQGRGYLRGDRHAPASPPRIIFD